jgi:hypothetical protein
MFNIKAKLYPVVQEFNWVIEKVYNWKKKNTADVEFSLLAPVLPFSLCGFTHLEMEFIIFLFIIFIMTEEKAYVYYFHLSFHAYACSKPSATVISWLVEQFH